MTKIAKLVAVSLLTRIIVDETDSEEENLATAKPQFICKINTALEITSNLSKKTQNVLSIRKKIEHPEIYRNEFIRFMHNINSEHGFIQLCFFNIQ